MAETIKNLPEEGWEYKVVNQLNGGLTIDLPSDLIEDYQFPDLNNVIYKDGIIKVDTGIVTFGNIVLGTPRAIFQFFLTDGSDYLVLLTNLVMYVWSTGTTSWIPYDNGNNTTTTGSVIAGATSVTLTAPAGYGVGDIMCVELDNGAIQAVTITSIASSPTIDFAGDPLQDASTAGNAVYETIKFAGTDDVQPSFTVFPANDWLIFTNGVDYPYYFDGTTLALVPNLPSAGATICKLVSTFNNRVLLANTTEAGTAYPQRVRWCDAGDPTNWSTGDSGYQDLYDSEDFIIASANLGPFLIYYRDRSIIRTSFVGSATKLFEFESVVSGEGAVSQDSVLDVGDFHTFFGSANIYDYEGGFDIKPVGDQLYTKIFSSTGELVPSTKHRTFGLYIEELDESWFLYSANSDETYPTRLIRRQKESWWQRDFPVEMSGFGYYENTGDVTWNDWADIAWTELDYAWNSKNLQSNSPIILLCGIDGQIYKYDYTASTDNGVAITYQLTTKDFGHPRVEYRFDEYEFYLSGTNILVEYTKDKGETWNTLDTFSPGAIRISNRAWEQVVSNYIGLRFSGSESFSISSFSFQYSVESEQGG